MRSRTKKLGVAVLTILLSVTSTAYADYTAVYDNSQKAIEISGNCIPGKAVVISVYKDTAAAPILADAVKSGTDGYYFFTMLLPKNLSGGKYYLKVGGEEIVYDFMYVDEDSITARLEELNAAAAQGGTIFENYLTANAAALSLDPQLLEQYGDRTSLIFCLNLAEPGLTDANDFINQYYQAVALAKISRGEAFDEVMQQYGRYLQFDAQEIYTALRADEQARFVVRLEGTVLMERPAEEAFRREALMSQLEAAATWERLRNVILGIDSNGETINENFSILNPDTTDYDNLTDQNAFYKALFTRKRYFTTLEAVTAQFEATAEECVESETPVRNSGASGGGGSGGAGHQSSSWYDVASNEPIKLGEDDQVQRETAVILSDIDGHWAQADIQALCDAKILTGYEDGTFQPDRTITRAEFAAVLARAFTLGDTALAPVAFSDVTAEDWYYEAIYEVQRAGIIQGYDGKFEPNAEITRQDMCVMIYRALNLTDESVPQFADADSIAVYARDAVGVLAEMGIVQGTDTGNFAPNDTATRAESAAIINRCRNQEVSE